MACDTSAGIRVSLLSRTQNTVRLQHPPIYSGKEKTSVLFSILRSGGAGYFANSMKKMHKISRMILNFTDEHI